MKLKRTLFLSVSLLVAAQATPPAITNTDATNITSDKAALWKSALGITMADILDHPDLTVYLPKTGIDANLDMNAHDITGLDGISVIGGALCFPPAGGGTLAVTSDLSGFVPYTGATTLLDMNNQSIESISSLYANSIDSSGGFVSNGSAASFPYGLNANGQYIQNAVLTGDTNGQGNYIGVDLLFNNTNGRFFDGYGAANYATHANYAYSATYATYAYDRSFTVVGDYCGTDVLVNNINGRFFDGYGVANIANSAIAAYDRNFTVVGDYCGTDFLVNNNNGRFFDIYGNANSANYANTADNANYAYYADNANAANPYSYFDSPSGFTSNGLPASFPYGLVSSAQITSPTQTASTGDAVMTKDLVAQDKSLATNVRVFPAYSGGNSGTASLASVNARGLGYAGVIAGTTMGGYGMVYMADSPFNNSYDSGAGITFFTNFKVSGSFNFDQADDHEGVARFLIGGHSGAAASADQDAFDNDGLGFEIRQVSTPVSGTQQVRLIYHDGTTYKQSAWTTFHTGVNSVTTSFMLHNHGDGNVDLYMRTPSTLAGPASLYRTSPLISITDASVGYSSYYKASIVWANVNDSTTYTTNNGTLLPSPITLVTP